MGGIGPPAQPVCAGRKGRAQFRDQGAARWGAGKWTLEVARRLDAEHPDAPIGSNTRMWVAVFDHAQTYHTRHIRPVHLQLQR